MRRRFGIEPAAADCQGSSAVDCRSEFVRCRRQPATSCQRGRGASQSPARRGQCRVGKIRPLVAFRTAQEHHAVAPLPERFGPRQPFDAEARDAFGQHARSRRRPASTFSRLLAKRQRAKPAQAARAQACGRVVEHDLIACLDAIARNALRSRRASAARRAEFAPARRCPAISPTARNVSRASGEA